MIRNQRVAHCIQGVSRRINNSFKCAVHTRKFLIKRNNMNNAYNIFTNFNNKIMKKKPQKEKKMKMGRADNECVIQRK